MKKIILSSLLAIFVVAVVAFAEYFPLVIVTGIGGKWVDTRAYTTIDDAITAIGANERILIITGEEAVGTLTIPINVRLKFMSNGSLAVTTQLTLQTYDIDAGDREIFSGAGDIDFPVGATVRSAWFDDLDEALDVTSDDTLTMVISRAETLTADATVGDNVTLRWESPFIITDGGFTLDGLKKIEAGTYQIFSGANDFDFLAGSIVHTSWFNRIRSAVNFTADEDVNLTIYVDQPETVEFDTTLDAYQALEVKKGCLITIETGHVLTLQSEVIAGEYQIFNLAGTGVANLTYHKVALPEWWGIDGTADDVQINNAVDAVGTSGIVQLGAKTYNVDAEILLDSNMALRGLGRDVSVIQITTAGINAVHVDTESNVEINDISFIGSDDDTTEERLVYFEDSTNSIVQDCSFSKSTIALQFHDSDDFISTNNFFFDIPYKDDNTLGYGILCDTDNTRFDLTNNIFNGVGRHAIYASSGSSFGNIVGNVIEGCDGSPIAVYSTFLQNRQRNINIIGNVINDTDDDPGTGASAAVDITANVENVVIKGNNIYDVVGYGIRVDGDSTDVTHSSQITIDGNIIDTTTSHGIYAINVTEVSIFNNQIRDTAAAFHCISTGVNGSGVGSFVDDLIIKGNFMSDGNYGISCSGVDASHDVDGLYLGQNYFRDIVTANYYFSNADHITGETSWPKHEYSFYIKDVAANVAVDTNALRDTETEQPWYVNGKDVYVWAISARAHAAITAGDVTAKVAYGGVASGTADTVTIDSTDWTGDTSVMYWQEHVVAFNKFGSVYQTAAGLLPDGSNEILITITVVEVDGS